MDHRIKALIAASLLSLSGLACAGYAQATPPKGWVPPPSGSGAPGGFVGTSAANTATFAQNTVRTNASLNVGGRIVTIPAEFRFAQNAPRYAAAAIMRHPYIRTAAAVATWLGVAGLIYDEFSDIWTTVNSSSVPVTGDYIYCVSWTSLAQGNSCDSNNPVVYFSDLNSALNYLLHTCREMAGSRADECSLHDRYNDRIYYPFGAGRGTKSPGKVWVNCIGQYYGKNGCTENPDYSQISEEEAIEELTRHPMPEEVPKFVPEPLPVELPSFPPFFVPSSEPRVNPNYDPALPASPDNAPYYQPGVEVKPAPTASSPWQVSLTPQNQPVVDPTQVGSETRPLPDGGGSGGGSDTKPPEAADDFCVRNPGVLACQTLEHENDDTTLPEKEIEFEFDLISGFADSASCPAFPNVGDMLGGKQISWQPFCDTLAKLKSLLLAFAWASAAFIILGYGRGD